MSLWTAILAWLAWLFTPVEIDLEAAKAAAAVHMAAASLVEGQPGPQPQPPAPKPDVCPDCQGTGWIVHGDGHRTPCPCGADPKRSASASPADGSLARPAGGR